MVVFEECYKEYSDDLNQVVQCVAQWAETVGTSNGTSSITTKLDLANSSDVRRWLLTICGAMVFFMQAGFAMICAGAVRKKNTNNTMLKNLLDVCGAGIAFYATGYAFAFGGSSNTTTSGTSFIGGSSFFLTGNDYDSAFFFFQFAFSATSTTIVAGTLAERCRMAAYLCFSIVLSGFVYPVVVHNMWHSDGIFSVSNSENILGSGVLDFSGSGVVHVTGGMTALYATWILGPRQGRFFDRHGNLLETPGLRTGSSIALQMLGTFILLFCWIGFNPGSALLLTDSTVERGDIAGHAAVTTVLSAAAATISALLFNAYETYRKVGEFDLNVVVAMNGCLTGLVAITGGCGIVRFWTAIFIGIVAGIVYISSVRYLLAKLLDDAVDAIPVHLFGGLWGVIAVGLFADPTLVKQAYGPNLTHFGWFYNLSDMALLGCQILEIGFIVGWVTVTMLPLFTMLQYVGWFRVNQLEEIVGLDTTYLDGNNMNDDNNSETDEVIRLAAYRQRFAERKNLLDTKIADNSGNNMDYDDPDRSRHNNMSNRLRLKSALRRTSTNIEQPMSDNGKHTPGSTATTVYDPDAANSNQSRFKNAMRRMEQVYDL